MSFYFLVNNLSFAFGMLGAIVLIVDAWFNFDAYKLQKDNIILTRSVGFMFFALWKIIDSLNLGSDLLSYFGFFIFIVGLALILISFVKTKQLSVNAVLVIPAFSLLSGNLYIISTILLFSIAYFAFKQMKKDFNRSWRTFIIAFLAFGFASFLNIFVSGGNQTSFAYILSHLVEIAGFVFLGFRVWQFMRMRISESFVMISVGVVFSLATIVTLAFSTILVGRVSTDTSANLLSDVKVLNLSLDSLKNQSLAEAELVSKDQTLTDAIASNNTVSLEQISERFLEQYNLGFLTITDSQGSVLVRANALSMRGDSLSGERAFQEAAANSPIATIENSPVEGFSVRAGAPIMSKNKIIGTIIAGFQLDNVFADKLKKLTGLEMLIYNNDKSIASTLFDTDGRTRLVGEAVGDSQIKNAVLTNDQTFTGSVNIYGNQFYASFLPLTNSDDKVIGMIAVATSQQNIVDIANATNRLTLITVLIIMLVLLVPIYMFSKRFNSVEST